MTKSKKKKLKPAPVEDLPAENAPKIPIANLPEDYLWMHVKSGTKMRNVLEYALEHFPKHSAIVWTAVGQGIEKGISCAEVFKRKHSGLHQVTKLRYVASDKTSGEPKDSKQSRIPEIHIFLSKNPTHAGETGYQGPEDSGEFAEPEGVNGADKTPRQREQGSSSGRITSLAAEEFASMGLRTGQKRSRRENHTEMPSKKNKKKEATE